MSTTVAPSPADVQVTPERLMQFAWAYSVPLVLEAAIRHRVFDVLDGGAMNLDALVQATGASRRGLAAICNVLVGLNFLSKDTSEAFSLTPESSAFLVSTKPSFMGGIIRHTSEQLLPNWLKLNDVVATGKPMRAVNQEQDGGEFFHEFVLDIFPMSYPPAKALATHMDHASAGAVSVLDLAAGSGVWGIAQAQSGPAVRVTAVDWPEVIDVTKKTVARFGLSDRYTFVEGDLASADFGSGHNLATLGHILHSEGEARSQALIEKVFNALAPGGTIAIQEFLVNADRTGPLNGLIFAVNMLVNTDEGDTFSFEEISGWLIEAGFVDPRMLAAPGPSPLILATKP
ncbi:acetylserotonin O-methyltransferase [Occallatibacter riparius]|uniref:Acetylserotonin O-methyltransferase n=1 Tax=Occallatibacter riparius TaxID=1002689 RepID=A0A9J7BN37_9BACT|nr:acetylserotonin O-methyltransferase [Occallatibacter riparius]UWZ82326.1 acetylserotonin O-methyltransferase [Occallatibacter riparius]